MTVPPNAPPPSHPARAEPLRRLLCELGDAIRDEVVAHRDHHGVGGWAAVVGRVEADVLYAVDRVSEHRVRAWLDQHWPRAEPVRLVMEGVEDDELVVVPAGTDPAAVRWILVVDPIDGTRNLMYDKRPAWVLTALAPARFDATTGRPGARLPDITVAAMTEIPTSKQWRADQLSAIRGGGPDAVIAEAVDVRAGERIVLPRPGPSVIDHVEHGFASFAHYLPDAKALLVALEQELWDRLVPPGDEPRPIFDDQYICTAGQLHAVAVGHDRLVGDLRPLALASLGAPLSLTSHPYDVCTSLLLTELGGLFEDPRGGPVDVPLDTTTPVTWVAYANGALAGAVRPVLRELLGRYFGATD